MKYSKRRRASTPTDFWQSRSVHKDWKSRRNTSHARLLTISWITSTNTSNRRWFTHPATGLWLRKRVARLQSDTGRVDRTSHGWTRERGKSFSSWLIRLSTRRLLNALKYTQRLTFTGQRSRLSSLAQSWSWLGQEKVKHSHQWRFQLISSQNTRFRIESIVEYYSTTPKRSTTLWGSIRLETPLPYLESQTKTSTRKTIGTSFLDLQIYLMVQECSLSSDTKSISAKTLTFSQTTNQRRQKQSGSSAAAIQWFTRLPICLEWSTASITSARWMAPTVHSSPIAERTLHCAHHA